MRQWISHVAVSVATTALCVSALGVTGCASKSPQPDTAKPSTTPTRAPETAKSSTTPSPTPDTAKPPATAQTPTPSNGDGAAAGGAVSTGGAGGSAAGGGAVSAGGAGGSAASRGAVTQPAVRTRDERRAALDQRLNLSLSAFDEKLRREQQRVAQERDARQTAVLTVASADNGGGAKGGLQRSTQGSSADEEGSGESKGSDAKRGGSRSTRAGDLKSDKAAGGVSTSGNGAVANEVPDGNDDDVVARRLRKAAEQETDPELKDKLWKEYVEYKKNTGK